ncbi:MAG: protein kinase [Planctomycetes bacterium]|nr:protein kinase [Planctomycetota bacterium]
MNADAQKVRSLFLAAVEDHAPGQWAAYLDEACAGDLELRGRVEVLLRAHQQPNSLLDAPVPNPVATVEEVVGERPGTVIGPYKLLEQIGEGGFGVVFMAEQQQPLRRKVALKVIKPGMDTRQVIARFEAERQALALMDHPHIAHIFDGGETISGRPYFVMELVRGIPITDFCDQNHLPVRERLELFVSVCQAVQHAHQKGIIHRDLKPTNVMVTLHDATPVVKVIDFGVAKAVGQQLTDKTLFTGFAQMVGTPLYMSPEQAGQSGLDADTRSDIYSLGVLLYELLTGTTPFDRERLRAAGYDELRRIIREEEPPRPSTRMSTLGQASATVSANRQSEPKRLSQLFRGELDWIVMKALEKDRNRRYETASAFAADVQRYLKDEPVQACPPSAWYRFRKFARRNKAALVIASVVLMAVLAVVGSVGWIIKDRKTQQVITEREVTISLNEATHLQSQSKWSEALAWVTRAEGVLAHGAGNEELRRRVQSLRADLEMVATLEEVRIEAPDLKDNVFEPARKDPVYERAFREYGIDVLALDPTVAAKRIQALSIRDHLTDALYDWIICTTQKPKKDHLWAVLCLADPDEWRSAFRGAIWRGDWPAAKQLAAGPGLVGLPPSNAAFLGRQLHIMGESSRALEILLAVQQRSPNDFWINQTLGCCYGTMKPPRRDQAIRYYTAAVALRPHSPGARINLSLALGENGSYDEALAAYREVIRLQPDNANSLDSPVIVLWKQGKLNQAIAACERLIELEPNQAVCHNELAWLLATCAEAKFRNPKRALELAKKAVALSPKERNYWNTLGVAHYRAGNWKEAVAALVKAMELDQGGHSCDWFFLAMAHWQLGDKEAARKWYDQAVEWMEKHHPQHEELRRFRAEAAELLGVKNTK